MNRVKNGRVLLRQIEAALMSFRDQKVESDYWETPEAKKFDAELMKLFKKINSLIPKDIQKIDKRYYNISQAQRKGTNLEQEVDRVTDSIEYQIEETEKDIKRLKREIKQDIYGDDNTLQPDLKQAQKKLKELDKAHDKIWDTFEASEKIMKQRDKNMRNYRG